MSNILTQFEQALTEKLIESDVVQFNEWADATIDLGTINVGRASYGIIQANIISGNYFKITIYPVVDDMRRRSIPVHCVDGEFNIEKVENWIQKFLNEVQAIIYQPPFQK